MPQAAKWKNVRLSDLSKSVIAVVLLSGLYSCSGNEEAASAKAVPKEIQAVDQLLARPYGDHFNNTQQDFAVANQIAGAIQNVVDRADAMSKRQVLRLMTLAENLIRSPVKDNYQKLVKEWENVKPRIKLAGQ